MSGHPPLTRELQLDEKWAFVGKKEQLCKPDEPADRKRGDRWDHTAVDPEHALLLALVPGKRDEESCRALLEEVKARTEGRTDLLLTSDDHGPYATAIKDTYGIETAVRPHRWGPIPRPRKIIPPSMCYATVAKTRKKGRVVKVVRSLVYGVSSVLTAMLARSLASSSINTAFVERHNGTDRGRNARKHRKTYCFSKRLDVHDAVSYFVGFSYNFCWPVRTLRERNHLNASCTPAMSARLTDHVWSLQEWATFPASAESG